MKLRLGLIAIATFIATVSVAVMPNWIEPFSTSQVLAQTRNERKAEGDRLLKQGIQQFQTNQFEAALQSWQAGLKIYREIQDRQGEGKALDSLGMAYNSLGDYAKTIEYQEQSLAMSRELQDRNNEGKALGNLGFAYINLGDYTKAIDYSQQSLEISQELQDRYTEGAALGYLGIAYRKLGDYAKAIDYLQQNLAIAREMKYLNSEANALSSLGGVYLNLGDYAKAVEYAQQSLAIARELKDRKSEGNALSFLGIAYNNLGNYAKAIEYQQQSLAIFQEIKDSKNEGKALSNLGIAYLNPGKYTKAIKYAQQHLAIARQIKDRNSESEALGTLGIAYASLGDYGKAIECGQQHLAIAREIKARQSEVWALTILGFAYYSLGDYNKAIEYAQQRLAIAKEINNRSGEGAALSNLGFVYDSLGDYAQAIEYQVQSLVSAREIKDRESESAALNNLGLVFFKKGELAKAEKTLFTGIELMEFLRKKLDEPNKVLIFETQVSTYYILQQVLIAQTKIQAALEISERGRARALVDLLASRLSDSPTAATSRTAPTIAQIQQIAKTQNATLVQYSIISDKFKVQGKEKFRESDLYIWVVKPTGEVAFRKADLKPLWQQPKFSLSRLASTNDSMIRGFENEQTNESYPDAIALFIIKVIGLIGIAFWVKQIFFIAKNVQISEVKYRWLVSLLLIVLAAGGSGGLIFWMTTSQETAQNRDFQTNSSLAKLILSTRGTIAKNERGLGLVMKAAKPSQSARLKQLYQILIQPIADLLPNDPNSKIVFIPQKALFLVPFAALKDANGKYFIEQHTVLTAPSIQVLDLSRQQREQIELQKLVIGTGEALVVGNPTMPSVPPEIGEPPQQLPSLPGAEEEANAIATLLKTQAMIGAKATKKAVLQKMRSARIIHLATHGLLDEFRGLGSAIALAPDSSPSQQQIGAIDGLLTAEEILDLKLNAELVVLSACDTGRGKITGDGVVGLSRSLISAGVPSVLVSLWSVPDAPTAELMTEFYRNWQRHPDKARALRLAMLTTMKQHPNPSDWAAFTLIGESE